MARVTRHVDAGAAARGQPGSAVARASSRSAHTPRRARRGAIAAVIRIAREIHAAIAAIAEARAAGATGRAGADLRRCAGGITTAAMVDVAAEVDAARGAQLEADVARARAHTEIAYLSGATRHTAGATVRCIAAEISARAHAVDLTGRAHAGLPARSAVASTARTRLVPGGPGDTAPATAVSADRAATHARRATRCRARAAAL